jgi:XRE family transcriptional regulator, fatty acid utilization regulator
MQPFRPLKNLANFNLQDYKSQMTTEMTNPLIGLRLKTLREGHNLNQEAMAQMLGIRDRQTVSAIENGERRAKPEELTILIDHFKLDSGYFTDPFRLVGEGKFSWRQSCSAPQALTSYQARAGRWLATYRALSSIDERPGSRERLSLRLSEYSSFEAAAAEGERISIEYRMGDVPARKLPSVMEDVFGILVLMVDMDEGISGAACRLPELDAVLVNRREPTGRRNFDLAHEFFHILTWDTMPPKEIELASEKSKSRIERLADNFASALLMPSRLLERYGEWRRLGEAELATRMRMVADHFEVSVKALYWRLVTLRLISVATKIAEMSPSTLDARQDLPPQFSKSFVRAIAEGIERGRLSTSRAAKLLEMSRELLRELFAVHAVPAPITV